jgi:hypothetical protein
MNSKFYGRKKLICIDGIRSKIETRAYNFDKVIVSYGVRSMKKQSSGLIEVNTVIIFLQFFYHGIIGVGLPMILEYFWELGIKDFFVKFNIFTNRFFVFLSLSLSAKKYRLNMDDNPEKTARYIIDFLDNIE